MTAHTGYFTEAPYGGSITIAATTRGDIYLGDGNTFNHIWLMPTTDATISLVRSDSTSQAPTSASSTAATGAFLAIPAYGKCTYQVGGNGRYIGLYNFGGAPVTIYYTVGKAPS